MFKNTMKTVVLLAGMGALFMAVGSLLGGTQGLVIGLAIGLVFVGGSYWFSDKLAVKSAGAVEITEADNPKLYGMVRDLAQRADMPMPRVYISPNQQPNAFATGRNEHHAAVAVTQGLLQTMSDNEVYGVLAHEISHVKHRDILISSVAAAVAMGIMFAARIAMWGAIFGGGGGRDRDGGNAIGALLMMILAPLAAVMLQAAISRSREFEADRGGAALVGNGEPLASALEKLDAFSKRVPMDVDPAQASAYIVNPLAGRKMQFANLFSTHPPTEERIRRLREVGNPVKGL